jgi:hypothetical protein
MASGMKVTPMLLLLGVALMLIVGYLIGRARGRVLEKFDGGGGNCNRCNKPRPCGCPATAIPPESLDLDLPSMPHWPSEAATKNLCNTCNKPKPCGCGSGGGRGGGDGAWNGMHSSQHSVADAGSNSSADGLPYAQRERCPPCPSCPTPDMSKWIKKSAVPPCPPLPDMSKYMLKTECPPLPDMSKYVLKSAVPKCPPCISTCSKPCKIGECPPCPRPRCPVVKCPDPKACPACPAAQCEPCPEPNIQCKARYEPSNPVRPMLASTSTFGL